jgi:K+-transporting ATPase KdpF subunit
MAFDFILAGIGVLGLMIYLAYTIIYPDRF